MKKNYRSDTLVCCFLLNYTKFQLDISNNVGKGESLWGRFSAQFRFGPKNSKKFLQYLLTIRSQFHPKRTTLIPPIHPEHPIKKWKLHRFYAVFLGKNPIKNPEKYIYRFLGSLISNLRYGDLHHVRIKVILRSECKKPDEKKKKKYIYI